jgi:hypothetical protein
MKSENKPNKKNGTKADKPEPTTENKNFTLFRLLLRIDALRDYIRLRDELRGYSNPEVYALIDGIENLCRQLV